jgi:hypothetical protein
MEAADQINTMHARLDLFVISIYIHIALLIQGKFVDTTSIPV